MKKRYDKRYNENLKAFVKPNIYMSNLVVVYAMNNARDFPHII